MEDITQTKEGFIKSMVLFVVLLFICFVPFIAFSQNVETVQAQSNQKVSSAESVSSETNIILFELGVQNNMVQLAFSTNYKSNAYSIEGRTDENSAFVSVLYCNDALCMDTRTGISTSYSLNEMVYTSYRVKTILSNGDIVYSAEKKVQIASVDPIELINTAVAEKLHIRLNTESNFTYSISNIKGENIENGDLSISNSDIDLSNREAGFYIISFMAQDGKEYHFKFFKTVNL